MPVAVHPREMKDVIVVGGGHNGLVAAALLARKGLKTLVLERADVVGGCARTGDLAPGFRCPTLAHAASIDPAIVRLLNLDRHGLEMGAPTEAEVCAPGPDGGALVLWRDSARAAREIARYSERDAARYPTFVESFSRVARVIRAVAGTVPASIDSPSAADVVEMIKAGRAFRSLGKRDAYRLLRWLPMAVADFTAEWFESEPLRATIAAGGVLGSFLGPRSAGSTALLLMLGAGSGRPIAPGAVAIAGGPGALAAALASAASAAGAEIRTGAEVAAIAVEDGTATGVRLASGEEQRARLVVSNLDVRRTLLGLVDPIHLDPEFLRRVRNVRTNGTLAKMNFAVGVLPQFSALERFGGAERAAALSGRIRLGDTIDRIERAFDAAKYGRFSEDPWIELTIPSLADPALAAKGHVVSAYVQYAPYRLRGTTWDDERGRLADAATAAIERRAPGFSASIVARETITPLDLERAYGLTGGHIFHGELALDQWFLTRPVLGWARYETPIRNLYLCGSSTHPGTGLTGITGALAARTIARARRAARP